MSNLVFKNIVIPILLQVRHISRNLSIINDRNPFVFSHRTKPPLVDIILRNFSQSNLRKQLKSDESYTYKNKLIKGMNFRCQEDAAPFYDLEVSHLLKIHRVTETDNAKGFCKNRLYYIADQLKCNPSKLSKIIARRIFIYELTFDWLESSLKVLLEMGVSGDRILRDLWVLKYNHETIKQRLQFVKDSGCDQVYPWMVRCPDETLHRNIKIRQEAKDILGTNNTTQEYLAQRLDTTSNVIDDMCLKVSYLRSIRVTKVKSFLDFLFSEGFTRDDIIKKPRVLAASQKTIKQRLNKLRSLGIASINLNILCRDRKEFKKYCESIEKFK